MEDFDRLIEGHDDPVAHDVQVRDLHVRTELDGAGNRLGLVVPEAEPCRRIVNMVTGTDEEKDVRVLVGVA